MVSGCPWYEESICLSWYDSLVGYLSLVPTGQAMDKVAYRHFLGKNIIYYHGIVWAFDFKERV